MFDTHKMTLRLWPRTNCIPQNSPTAPLYCQVRINGVRTSDFAIDVSVPIGHWSQKAQQVENHPLAQELNTAIFRETKKIFRIKEELEEKGQVFTAATIRIEYVKFKKERMNKARLIQSMSKVPSFFSFLESHLKDKINEGCSYSTAKNNRTFVNNWKSFLISKKLLTLPVNSVDYGITDQFSTFLRDRNVGQNHISNHLSIAEQALRKAVKAKILPINPLAEIELIYTSNFDPEGLEPEQVEQLILCTKYTEREQKAVYAFLFMCSTGMDYCDYSPRDFTIEQDSGKHWITYPRQKNQHRKFQPDAEPFLLDFGVEIWKKFDKNVEQLPTMSLTEMNRVIKVAARKAGVVFKKLTTKRARKTYANILANDVGLSDEAMICLMGHTTTKHLRAYRKIKRRRVLAELTELGK